MPEKEENLQSAWNISQHLINQIAFLLQGSSLAYLSGQIHTAFFNTEEIRTLIHSFLSSDEEKTLDKLGSEIYRLHTIYNNIGRHLENQSPSYDEDEEDRKKQILRFRKAKNFHAFKVKRYRRFINELLGKYGLGMASREDASKMF